MSKSSWPLGMELVKNPEHGSFFTTDIAAQSLQGRRLIAQLQSRGYEPLLEPRSAFGSYDVINLTGADAQRFHQHGRQDFAAARQDSERTAFIQKIPHHGGEGDFIRLGGRVMAVVEINGVNVPFYISSGAGGKKSVEQGRWYPIFGIGEDGWFNKGPSESDVNNFYGSHELKTVARWLDKNYGDIRGRNNIPAVPDEGPHMAVINRDMTPFTASAPEASGSGMRAYAKSIVKALKVPQKAWPAPAASAAFAETAASPVDAPFEEMAGYENAPQEYSGIGDIFAKAIKYVQEDPHHALAMLRTGAQLASALRRYGR